MKIEIIDNVFSLIVDKEGIDKIKNLFEYSRSYWISTQYRKIEKVYKKNFLEEKFLLNGFIPKLKELVDLKINGTLPKIGYNKVTSFDKIILREEQIFLLEKVLKYQRGVILSPTGSGKTVIITSIIHSIQEFSDKIIVICNRKDLMYQLVENFENYGIRDINVIGDNKKNFGKINVGLIQTLSKLKNIPYFDAIIIDEVHNCNKVDSQFGKFMLSNNSKMRIGFTATLPEKKENLLSLEGIVGPVIGEFTLEKGIEIGRLTKPKITLLKSNISTNENSYQKIYKEAIVNNAFRNRLIIRKANSRIEKGKSCLIFVKEIDHGKNLLNIVVEQKIFDKEQFIFINGSDSNDIRKKTKYLLENKEIKCVITTTIWKEGIDIKTLDCIINAAGGKSEIMVLQTVGRGLRKAEGKSQIEVIDFLDNCKYLSQHCVKRLQIYVSKGWL